MDGYPYGIRGVTDVKECAISGAKIRPGDVAVSIKGTDLFYRIASRVYKQFTPEKRAEIETWIVADAGVIVAQDTFDTQPETFDNPSKRGFRKAFNAVEIPSVGDDNGS